MLICDRIAPIAGRVLVPFFSVENRYASIILCPDAVPLQILLFRRRLQAQGVPVPRFSLARTSGLTVGTVSTADMAGTELSPRLQQPQRYERFLYRWQQQPIQRPRIKTEPDESPRSKKHHRNAFAADEVSDDDWQLALVDDTQQGFDIVPLSRDGTAGARDSDPPPLLLADGAFDEFDDSSP